MIIISPFAKKLREEKIHPKNYPYWNYVIEKIKEEIIQVGVEGELQLVSDFRKNLSMFELKSLILECKTWISVDSFFQHYCWELKKPGIVLFGPSDPNIFGHPENINLLKDRKYLREKQHWLWEQCDFDENAFVKSNEVINALKKFNVNVND
jgi:ADP-heptose:LPS heptosyltransferase